MNGVPLKTESSTLSDFSLLKTELVNLIAERDQLVNVVIPNIEAEYQLKIGFLEYELFEVQLSVNRLKRGIALAQAAVNRGEVVSVVKIEETLQEEFLEWERKLRAHMEKIEEAKNRVESLLPAEDSREIARIYKKIVKMLHPDVSPEAYEKNRDLWERASEAYRAGDLEGLRVLLILIEDAGEVPPDDSEYREKRKKSLKASIKKLLSEISALKSRRPYTLEDKLTDGAWVGKEQERLRSEIREQALYRKHLEEIFDKLCFHT